MNLYRLDWIGLDWIGFSTFVGGIEISFLGGIILRCPHCNGSISLFSKSANSLGRRKKCPHCSESYEIAVNWRRVFILLVPASLFGFVMSQLLLAIGIPGSFGTALMVLVLVPMILYAKH